MTAMDIKQRLSEYAQPSSLNPIPLEPSVPLVLDALAEIERLEGEVRVERSLKNQARADLVKCADRLNAYTDRMITAGLMS